MLGHSGNPWFAVHVRPQHERKVATLLGCKGYQQFLPTYLMRRNCGGQTKTIEKPLFPGYVFCRVDEPVFGLVRTTPGVIKIVGVAGRPFPIPDEEINAVFRVLEAGTDVCPCALGLKAGEKVLVKKGPLSGVIGKFARVRNHSRLIILVELTMKAISVEIDAEDVMPFGVQAAMSVENWPANKLCG